MASAAVGAGADVRCSICYEVWSADEVPRGIRCAARGHFVDDDCLALLTCHELDVVRLAKCFGEVGCPDPGCVVPEGGAPYPDGDLRATLGGEGSEPWRSFVAARSAVPLRLAREQPPTKPLVQLSPELAIVEPWLRCLEFTGIEPVFSSPDMPAPAPLRLWACRGLGGGDGSEGGLASAGGLGVQLWPAAITLAARMASFSQSHSSVCDLGCGVGLVGLAWLHAAMMASGADTHVSDASRPTQRRRLVMTDGDSECLALARCNVQAVQQQHVATIDRADVRVEVLRWGDVEAARALAQQPCDSEPPPDAGPAAEGIEQVSCSSGHGFDLIVGTDLLYFAGAEVAHRLAVTIATLLSPSAPCIADGEQKEGRHNLCDRKAVLANHGGWFNDSLEQCLRDGAVSATFKPLANRGLLQYLAYIVAKVFARLGLLVQYCAVCHFRLVS